MSLTIPPHVDYTLTHPKKDEWRVKLVLHNAARTRVVTQRIWTSNTQEKVLELARVSLDAFSKMETDR